MKLIIFALLAALMMPCAAQPEHTRRMNIRLLRDDRNLTLHCRQGNYIVSFNPADLYSPFQDEKKKLLEGYLNRNDTLSLDSLVETAAALVRDSTIDFCSLRFSSVVSRNFLNGNIAVRNIETNVLLKKITALIDDRMGWMLVNYYYFMNPQKSIVLFEYCDVSFGCPAF